MCERVCVSAKKSQQTVSTVHQEPRRACMVSLSWSRFFPRKHSDSVVVVVEISACYSPAKGMLFQFTLRSFTDLKYPSLPIKKDICNLSITERGTKV